MKVIFDREDVRLRGKTIHAQLLYPRSEERPDAVEIELGDTRAADSVRVSYDFDRDGWVIQQATRFTTPDPEWIEVAFVKAWASALPGEMV